MANDQIYRQLCLKFYNAAGDISMREKEINNRMSYFTTSISPDVKIKSPNYIFLNFFNFTYLVGTLLPHLSDLYPSMVAD